MGADADISVGSSAENAVEPSEKFSERAASRLLGPQKQRAERRAQGECVEGGENYRDSDGDGKLLVKATGDAGDERGRYKYGGENQGDGDNRAGDFLHRSYGRVVGSHTALDVVLARFNHNDGVVNDEADGENESEERECVDGEAEDGEDDEGADE